MEWGPFLQFGLGITCSPGGPLPCLWQRVHAASALLQPVWPQARPGDVWRVEVGELAWAPWLKLHASWHLYLIIWRGEFISISASSSWVPGSSERFTTFQQPPFSFAGGEARRAAFGWGLGGKTPGYGIALGTWHTVLPVCEHFFF